MAIAASPPLRNGGKSIVRTATAGFSAIELLVVIALGGILLAVAWLRISTLAPIYRLEGAARGLAADIQRARSRAIAEGKCFEVLVTTGTSSTYQLMSKASCSTGTFTAAEGAKQVDDANSLTVQFSGGTSSPVFNSRGTVDTTAVITLRNRDGAARTVGVEANGHVYVQ